MATDHVLLEHPDTGGRARFPARSVDHWVGKGWVHVDDEDLQDTPPSGGTTDNDLGDEDEELNSDG